MAWAQDGPYISENAGADLSASQYRAVALNSSSKIVLAAAAGADTIGILQNDPKLDEDATVKYRDVTKAVAGGAFNPGDRLTTDASGRVVVAAVGNTIIGRALTAGALGRVVAVLIRVGGVA